MSEKASSNDEVLCLNDVHVRYRIPGEKLLTKSTVHAVTSASTSVRAGETLGIVGESGCGKSTLAKAIVGLQRPTEGEVLFHGRDIWSMPSTERRKVFGKEVGMIFQDPSTALNRRLPVHKILRDPMDVHKMGTPAEREQRVRHLMELVGLPTSAADALPAQLSGGQRQRVAIGRALALSPSLLVADEPTSALDVSVRAQILNLLETLKREMNIAMVFISHDIQTVRYMSDRIVTMYLGRIVEDLPSSCVPDSVRHPYTAALLSATPSLLHESTPIRLDGPVPSAVNPPEGCSFHPRCWRATETCRQRIPDEVEESQSPRHAYACFRPTSGLASAMAENATGPQALEAPQPDPTPGESVDEPLLDLDGPTA